jgi:hypothetical protein
MGPVAYKAITHCNGSHSPPACGLTIFSKYLALMMWSESPDSYTPFVASLSCRGDSTKSIMGPGKIPFRIRLKKISSWGVSNRPSRRGFRCIAEASKPGSQGRAIAQAVSRWLPTMATWVGSCGICGGQSGTGAGFLRILWFSCQFSLH